MLDRCLNENCGSWKNYGGRGITVCDRWRTSYDAFLTDMGVRPHKGLSLDRINNDGNYEPGNCRWATQEQQSANMRHNGGRKYGDAGLLTHRGESLTIREWSEKLGIPYNTIHKRLWLGHSVEDALSTEFLVRGGTREPGRPRKRAKRG